MKISIINYGAGNVQSIIFALERLGCKAIVSDCKEEIMSADKVIFPGVGEASSAMKKLKSHQLDSVIPQLTQPILGICLGMQLMCKSSEEGNTKGLGIFDCDIVKFEGSQKVPQIGWNTISKLQSPLFKGVPESAHMYLVHSFYAPLCKETVAHTFYERLYSSALHYRNFYGVQFHPEKSSEYGALVLKNFLELS